MSDKLIRADKKTLVITGTVFALFQTLIKTVLKSHLVGTAIVLICQK